MNFIKKSLRSLGRDIGIIKTRKRRKTRKAKIKSLRTQAKRLGVKVVSKNYGNKRRVSRKRRYKKSRY